MNQVIILLMALVVIGWVTYPLVKGIQSPEASLEEEIEREVQARRRRRRKKRALACPNCGNPYKPGDVYCSKCGTKLK